MNILIAKISLLIVAATMAPPVRAELSSTASDATMHSIALSVSSRPTHSSAALSPSSQFTREQALALADVLSKMNGRDVIVSAVAATGSMRPYFDENALLLLERVPFGELRLGDVVTFIHPRLKIEVVHRLVEKRGKVFWSKGDHNSAMDDIYVTPENFRRRLVGVIYMRPDVRAPRAGAASLAALIESQATTQSASRKRS